MPNHLIRSLDLSGFLSFRPDSPPIPLTPLNVLIGPNGSGKSNLIEAIELLKATSGDLAAAVRLGGMPSEWVWKGNAHAEAQVSAVVAPFDVKRPLRYRLAFAEVAQRLEIIDEAIEETAPTPGHDESYFYYRFQRGQPVINTKVPATPESAKTKHVERKLKREDLNPQQSVLSQRKDPDLYPEITSVAKSFGAIQTFREWSFGRLSPPRLAQRTDQSAAVLDSDGSNLGLIVNEIRHTEAWSRLTGYLRRFLPRFSDLSTRVQAGSVQVYLHEQGLRSPVPATRLSDGTIRFIALLAILLRAEAHSVICIEEPELGLHPDALDLVAELLVEAAGKSQVIATTHSDVLVSALTDHADSVLVCEYLGDGTRVTRLDSARLKSWLEDYRLGEVWRIGEIGGNP